MPKNSAFEYVIKQCPVFVTKIDEAQGIVEAIVNTYGILDLGNDVSVNGMCAKSINERGRQIQVLNSHNSKRIEDVIGIPLEVREVGRGELPEEVKKDWPEATGGLFTRTRYLLETPEGLGAFVRIKAGAIKQYSIGFEIIRATFEKFKWRDTEVNARFLREIKLWEFSPVAWGMNPGTATADVKADEKPALEKDGKVDPTKEMTPQGAVSRMGDLLQGRMRYVCNMYGNDWLAAGKLNNDQVKSINSALETAMATFLAALPEDVALMPAFQGFFYYDGLTPTTGEKSATQPAAPMMTAMVPFGYGIPMMLAAPGAQVPTPLPVSKSEPTPAPAAAPQQPEAKAESPDLAGSGAEASAAPQPAPAAPALTDTKAREDLLKQIESEKAQLELVTT